MQLKLFFYTFGHLKRRFLYSKNYIKIIYCNTLMNIEEVIKENLLLREENDKLKNELNLTKEHLKKYTAPSSKKLYYEQNKEEIKKKVKEYKENINYVVPKEVIKERNKRAYQKRKEKEEKEKFDNQNI